MCLVCLNLVRDLVHHNFDHFGLPPDASEEMLDAALGGDKLTRLELLGPGRVDVLTTFLTGIATHGFAGEWPQGSCCTHFD